jgi:hypothetical protein
VNYFIFILCLKTADERAVYPDEIGKGFQTYIDLKIEKVVYNFICTYVRRIKPNVKWKKLLMKNAGCPFICCITPSNIAYVLAIIKNGKEMWDQAKNPGSSPEKKARPLFSAGEGRKRESGISVWNKEGLEFYYAVEKNWREVYNSKKQFSVLINGWENWEPKDKSKKDALRTYWTKDKEEDTKMSNKKNVPQEKHWWEQEDEGYNTDRNLKAEYDWEKKNKKLIKERLGVVEEDTDDDGVGKMEGEKNNNNKDDSGMSGDDVKKGGGKVVEGIINKSKEEDDNDNKGHRKCRSNRKKK